MESWFTPIVMVMRDKGIVDFRSVEYDIWRKADYPSSADLIRQSGLTWPELVNQAKYTYYVSAVMINLGTRNVSSAVYDSNRLENFAPYSQIMEDSMYLWRKVRNHACSVSERERAEEAYDRYCKGETLRELGSSLGMSHEYVRLLFKKYDFDIAAGKEKAKKARLKGVKLTQKAVSDRISAVASGLFEEGELDLAMPDSKVLEAIEAKGIAKSDSKRVFSELRRLSKTTRVSDKKIQYSDEDIYEAIREAYEYYGGVLHLSAKMYGDFVAGREGYPSKSLICSRSSWATVCNNAGVPCGGRVQGAGREAFLSVELIEDYVQKYLDKNDSVSGSDFCRFVSKELGVSQPGVSKFCSHNGYTASQVINNKSIYGKAFPKKVVLDKTKILAPDNSVCSSILEYLLEGRSKKEICEELSTSLFYVHRVDLAMKVCLGACEKDSTLKGIVNLLNEGKSRKELKDAGYPSSDISICSTVLNRLREL